MKIPYERVVAYLVGPLAAAIGLGATAVVHANISKSSAVLVATFVLSSAATALGHWKWLANLTKWWDSAQNQAAAATASGAPAVDAAVLEQGPPADDPPAMTRTPVVDVPPVPPKPKGKAKA